MTTTCRARSACRRDRGARGLPVRAPGAVRGQAADRRRPRTAPLLAHRVAGAQVPRRQPRLDLPPGGHPGRPLVPRPRPPTGQDYISFTVHGADPTGGFGGPVLADINDDAIDFGPDGSFELILSADERPGNWVPLDPVGPGRDRAQLLPDERPLRDDDRRCSELEIEPLDIPVPPPTPTTPSPPASKTIAMLKANTLGLRVFGDVRHRCRSSRTCPTRSARRSTSATGEDVAGAVDIYYSTGSFELGPDDALVIEGTIPRAVHQRDAVERAHADARVPHAPASLNHEQIVPEPAAPTGSSSANAIPASQLARHVRAPARLDLLALPAAGGGAGHAAVPGRPGERGVGRLTGAAVSTSSYEITVRSVASLASGVRPARRQRPDGRAGQGAAGAQTAHCREREGEPPPGGVGRRSASSAAGPNTAASRSSPTTLPTTWRTRCSPECRSATYRANIEHRAERAQAP